MPDNQEEILREVKGFGENVKNLKDSMQKDLEAVRKLAEEAKGAAERPEVKAQIDALTTLVTEKNAKLEEIVQKQVDRADQIEAAMKRLPVESNEAKDDETKAAMRFFESKMALTGNLTAFNRPSAETIDREGYQAWTKGFDTYLRANDERRVEAKALSVGSNPDGGYLVPTQVSNRIITKIWETSPIRQMATVETIGTSELELPIDVDEATTGWVGETQTRAETNTSQVGVQKIPVHEMYALPKTTQKFLEDASINVEAWLASKIGDKLARTEATAFVSGDGVNQPRGILSYGAGTGRDLIPQIVSGAATSITADALMKVPFEVKAAYMANGAWLMKRSSVQAVMLLKDGDGQYFWRPNLQMGVSANGGNNANGGVSGAIYGSTVAGYPVMLADDMPAIGAGALAMAFGDFRRGYTVVDRLGITTLRDPYSAKPFVQFYTRKRVGGAVVDFDAFVLVKIAAS
jgi:HK97 family phage major capsid protein